MLTQPLTAFMLTTVLTGLWVCGSEQELDVHGHMQVLILLMLQFKFFQHILYES